MKGPYSSPKYKQMKPYTQNFRKVSPYTPGEQPGKKNIIKLNTNENPYPPSPMVKEALSGFNIENLRLYPSFVCSPLKKALISNFDESLSVKEENIFLGNGSDEVIALIFQSLFCGEKEILFPDITYSFYEVWAKFYNVKYKTIPLKKDFTIDPEAYRVENSGIILANPNAPTGIYAPLSQIEDILKANPSSVVVVDEAYIDFGGESALKLLPKYENLVVVRTYSKSMQLAGIRVGYAIASKETVATLEAVKNCFNSYTLSSLSQVVGEAAAKDKEYFRKTTEKIIKTREYTVKKLSELGFKSLESKVNFIFTTHESKKASFIFEELKKKDIYVRYFNKPLIYNYLRITIGTDEEMEKLIQALDSIVKS